MHSEFDWEGRYREDTARWDKGAVVPGLAAWLQRASPRAGKVVVPGCGRGHEAAAVAAAWPGSEVEGIDLSETAVAEARARYQAPNLTFTTGDAFAGGASGALEAVVEHTCFCAIPPGMRSVYKDTWARRLRKGGVLVAVFYLHPVETEEEPDDGPPWGTSVPELDGLFAEEFTTLVSRVPEQAFPGRERRELLRVFERK